MCSGSTEAGLYSFMINVNVCSTLVSNTSPSPCQISAAFGNITLSRKSLVTAWSILDKFSLICKSTRFSGKKA